MKYAEFTTNDRNPLKRLIHRRRMADALYHIDDLPRFRKVIDFGAGDGHLCRQLADRAEKAIIFCYEPCSSLREEAVNNLRYLSNVKVISSLEELTGRKFDLLFCMEVFEHLPQEETFEAIESIYRLLEKEGIAVIGVPIEVFLPAFFKGVYRFLGRRGEFDAKITNILRATFGMTPGNRPAGELESGLNYYFYHLGFDHRRVYKLLKSHFEVLRVKGSPFKRFGTWLNSEVYFVVKKVG